MSSLSSKVIPSSPSAGETLQTALSPWATPLWESFVRLCQELTEEERMQVVEYYSNHFFYEGICRNVPSAKRDQAVSLANAALLSTWMTASAVHPERSWSLASSLEWFLGSEAYDDLDAAQLPSLVKEQVEALSESAPDRALSVAALPYLFEAFETGPVGTQRAADQAHRNNREAKRRRGVFYTPRDVADYIAGTAIGEWKGHHPETEEPVCFDPACGTGAILQAALRALTEYSAEQSASRAAKLARTCIFGADLSSHALQSCAFSLTAQAVAYSRESSLVPVADLWSHIRANLRAIDSTTLIRPPKGNTGQHAGLRSPCQDYELADDVAPERRSHRERVTTTSWRANPDQLTIWDTAALNGLAAESEPALYYDIILGNPPYSTVEIETGRRDSAAFMPFLEMTWRLTTAGGCAGMILPLSITYHSGKRFRSVRSLMELVQGRWKIASFDRTPDSLFGDDVRTRNSVVFLRKFTGRDVESHRVETTGLIRWTSRQRSTLFNEISFASLPSDLQLRSFIPKLGSTFECELYSAVRDRSERLGTACRITSSKVARGLHDGVSLFVAPTAYNWLSVYCGTQLSDYSQRSGLTQLAFDDRSDADIAFAILSSRLAYWLWRVEGDGFHVTRSFLARIPMRPDSLDKEAANELRDLGLTLSNEIQSESVVSYNSGTKTVSFSPWACPAIVDEIDSVLTKEFSLPAEAASFFREFLESTTAPGE